MNLSADVGEGAADDEAILGCIDSASVCCGAHAGSPSIAVATARRCGELGLEVGAHPGYADRERFGRFELGLTAGEIEELVEAQVAALAQVTPVAYVKPHGALYHRCQSDPSAADALARVARRHDSGLMGQPAFEILAAARRAGIPSYREGFVDRALQADGSLVPRDRPGAVLSPEMAVAQAIRLARTDRYDSLCLHGDTPGAGRLAAAVRQALRDAGIATAPLRVG